MDSTSDSTMEKSREKYTDQIEEETYDQLFSDLNQYGCPQMDQLMNFVVAEIPSDWYEVGIQLKIGTNILDGFKITPTTGGEPKKMFCEVLKQWEKNPDQTAPFNWETILNALASPSVNRRPLAESIVNKIKSHSILTQKIQNKCHDDNKISQEFHDDDNSDMSSSVSGFGYYTEDDIKKLCGCGNCSLDSIITRGCTRSDVMPRFPLLDVQRLPECKLQQYIYILEKEAAEINTAFACLLGDICESMKDRVGVKSVVNFIKASRYIETTTVDVAPKMKQTLESACDMDDVFSVLTDFCSWFNHHPLESLIKRYGLEEDKLSYENFKRDKLMKYLQRSVTEIPKDAFGAERIEGSGVFKLKLGHQASHQSIAGEQMIYLKGKVAEVLNIPIHSLHLHAIRKGCLELDFSIPLFIYEQLFCPFSVKNSYLLSSILIGANDNPICIKSIWYEEEYHKIPFELSTKEGNIVDSADVYLEPVPEEFQESLRKRNLTFADLKQNKLHHDTLEWLSKIMDDLNISGFWQALSTEEKKNIRLKSCTGGDRRLCILRKWSEVMASDTTYYNFINTLNECGDTLEQVLDYLKETLSSQMVQNQIEEIEPVASQVVFDSRDLALLHSDESYLTRTCTSPNLKLADFSYKIQESQIIKKFNDILEEIRICLNCRSDITVDHLIVYLLSRQRISFLNASSQIREHLQRISTKDELMNLMKEHVNWFNHSFLGSFTNQFNVACEKYENYITDELEPLLMTSLLEFPAAIFSSCKVFNQIQVQLNFPSQQNFAANVLISFKAHVAFCLSLSIDAIDLCSYDSSILVFSVPLNVLHNERPLLVGHVVGATLRININLDDKKILNEADCVYNFWPHITDSDMTKIDRAFSSLLVQLFGCITDVDDIKKFINTELVIQLFVQNIGNNYSPLFDKNIINGFTNFKDLFFYLSNYWSFFNFALLEKFIKRFGSKEIKNVFTDYTNLLKNVSLSKLPNCLHPLSAVDGFLPSTLTVKVGTNFFNHSVDALLQVHDKVAQTLHIQRFALLLQQINRKGNGDGQLDFLVADTGFELTRFTTSIMHEFDITSFQFQGSELKASGDDDHDFDDNDGDSGVGNTTDYSDAESLYQDQVSEINEEDQQPLSLESESTYTAEDYRSVTPLAFEELKDNTHTYDAVNDWPSLEDMEHLPNEKRQIEKQQDKLKAQSDVSVNLSKPKPDSEKLIHHTSDPYKGVIQVCSICLYNYSGEDLLLKKCIFPNVHKESPFVHAAWDSNMKKIIQINPRPLAPIRDLFQLCDPARCRGGTLCTFSHNKIECDAWNYDLIKERANFGLPVMTFSPPAVSSATTQKLSHSNYYNPNYSSHKVVTPFETETGFAKPPPIHNYDSKFNSSVNHTHFPIIQKHTPPTDFFPFTSPYMYQASDISMRQPNIVKIPLLPMPIASHKTQTDSARHFNNNDNSLIFRTHDFNTANSQSIRTPTCSVKTIQNNSVPFNSSSVDTRAVKPSIHTHVVSKNFTSDSLNVDFPPLPSKPTSAQAHTNPPLKSVSIYSPAAFSPSQGKCDKPKIHVKEREEWKLNFMERINHTVLKDEAIEPEFSSSNYRDNFYYLLCFEESEHINILTGKCDGQYTIQWLKDIGSSCMCRVKGMNDDQVQYAVQASEAVYFIDFENNKKNDICKGTIDSSNFRDVSEYFYITMLKKDFDKIKSSCKCLNKDSWYEVHMEFEVKHSYFNGLHQAVISIPDSMIKKIVPTKKDALLPGRSIATFSEINPISPHLQLCIDDKEQYEALKAILTTPVNFPVIISGPFGSGKTRILARAAYEFALEGLHFGKQRRILICAHHINTIETFLSKYLEPALSKTTAVKIIRIVRSGEFNLKSYSSKNIINRRIIDFKNEVLAGQHVKDPVLIIISTYMSSLQIAKVLNRHRFTHVLLDEAAQVREPEAIAALSLGDANTKVIITGDSKQVGPSVLVLGDKPNQCGLGTSLLERLEQLYITLNKDQLRAPFCLRYLSLNYRCHQGIVDFLSRVIYRYPIHCASKMKQPHPLVRFPCIFYWSNSKDKNAEAEAVCTQANRFFSSWHKEGKAVSRKEMCIISPFRTQLNIIKSRMQSLVGITFLPSYTIQGHEFEAIILSTFEPLEDDGTSSNPTKSLVNPKIFNTAISRCKSFVVAVGNPFVLLKAEEHFSERCWKHYLRACLENETLFFSKNHRHSKKELKERLKKELK